MNAHKTRKYNFQVVTNFILISEEDFYNRLPDVYFGCAISLNMHTSPVCLLYMNKWSNKYISVLHIICFQLISFFSQDTLENGGLFSESPIFFFLLHSHFHCARRRKLVWWKEKVRTYYCYSLRYIKTRISELFWPRFPRAISGW
jgi:hypothetical protein